MRAIAWFLALLLVGPVAALAATDAARVAVRTGEHADKSRIVFDWTSAVDATVETPADGALIIRFDKLATFDLSKANAKKLSRVAAIAPVEGQAAVRITLRGNHQHKLSNAGTKIVVDILDDQAGTQPAKTSIKKKTSKQTSQEQAQFSQHGTAASPPVDAATSDRPAKAHQDDASPPAPTSSTTAPAGRSDTLASFWTEPAREAGAARPEPEAPLPDPLFDPAAWRGHGSYMEGRAEWAERVAETPQDTGMLLALAQFLFAWRHTDEALSVLASITDLDPKLGTSANVQALADAAQILAGRPATAGELLRRASLDARPEAQLWRGAMAALNGDSEAAFPAFEKGWSALERYPQNFRSFFGLLAMQAAIDQGVYGKAKTYGEGIGETPADPDDAAMLTALNGLRLARQQLPDEARPLLLKAARSPGLKPQIVARLALIDLDRAAGRIDSKTELEALEQLAVSWEGDALQLEILDRLMQAYALGRRYDDAFDTAELAAHQFPGNPRSEKLTAAARSLFRDLLAGQNQALDPIEAMALYNGHPELMPDGAEAAEIKRGLARQMAALDLAEPAAQLYQEAPGFKAAGTETESNAAKPATSATGDAQLRADGHWRDGQWAEAGADYLLAAAADAAAESKPHFILRAAAAYLLAGKTDELQTLHGQYAAEMAKAPAAAVFEQLTAPGAGVELLAQPEIAEAIVRRP